MTWSEEERKAKAKKLEESVDKLFEDGSKDIDKFFIDMENFDKLKLGRKIKYITFGLCLLFIVIVCTFK